MWVQKCSSVCVYASNLPAEFIELPYGKHWCITWQQLVWTLVLNRGQVGEQYEEERNGEWVGDRVTVLVHSLDVVRSGIFKIPTKPSHSMILLSTHHLNSLFEIQSLSGDVKQLRIDKPSDSCRRVVLHPTGRLHICNRWKKLCCMWTCVLGRWMLSEGLFFTTK